MRKLFAILMFAAALLSSGVFEAANATASRGLASFYGYRSKTANGEMMNPSAMTAPFGTHVRVTDVSSRRSVVVRINDRGPFVRGRIIDLSTAAAQQLGITGRGVAMVEVEVVS